MTTTPGEIPSEHWQRELDAATCRAITAAEDSVKAAVLLLATGARECWPTAQTLTLSESDQGNWLWVDTFDGLEINTGLDTEPTTPYEDARNTAIGDFNNRFSHAASCLYTEHLTASPHLRTNDDGLTYFINITETLDR